MYAVCQRTEGITGTSGPFNGLREGMAVPGFCKYICPAGTLEGAMGLLANPGNSGMFSMLGIFFTRKFVILLIIALACIFCYRSFCRFLCPLGAIFSLMPVLPFSTIRRDRDACLKGCSLCTRSCPAAIELPDIHSEDVTNLSGECFQCGNCVYHCPKANCRGIVNPGDIQGLIWQCVRSALLILLCFYLTHKLV